MKKLILPVEEDQNILSEKEVKPAGSPLIWIVILSAVTVVLLYVFRDTDLLRI